MCQFQNLTYILYVHKFTILHFNMLLDVGRVGQSV